MLRTVRRRARRPAETLSIIGIGDWAFRRGQRYGTLICDPERRHVVALLPDPESGTVEAWLSAHPEIALLARDRGGCYGEAVGSPASSAALESGRPAGDMSNPRWGTRQGTLCTPPHAADDDRVGQLSKAEAVTVATIEAAILALDEASSRLSDFYSMIRE